MPAGARDGVIRILYLTIGLSLVAVLAVAYLLYRWFTYDPTARPEWARFLTDEQWQALIGHVKAHFEAQAMEARISDGVVVARGPDAGPHQYGLANLAQMCHQAEPDEWPAIVNGHFGAMLQGQQESQEIEANLSDFSRVQDILMVRINTREDLPAKLDLVTREDLPGTLSYLVIDLPNIVRSISRKDTEAWGKTPEELFSIALDNVCRTCVPDHEEVELKEDVSCRVLSGESFFAATHALLLDKHPECLGERGAIVAIPNRHAVLAFPIDDIRALAAIPLVGSVATNMAKEGPGTITAQLYWYHDGQFIDLPYSITGKTFNFVPPAEFVELMNSLAPDDDESGS